MKKTIYFSLVFFFSLIVAFFHFLRLTFEWRILIADWFLPVWISGLLVVLGISMAYYSFKNK
jgi:uncharacterized membrane protein